MNSKSKPGAKQRWREVFLLEQRLEAARRTRFRASDPGWGEFALGRAALSDANQLAQSSDGASSALLLYRAALVLFASALRARPAQPAETPEAAPQQVLLPAREAALAELPEEQRAVVQGALEANPAEVHLASLSDAQRQLALSGMQRAARALGESLEEQASAVQRLTFERWFRIVTASGLLVLIVVWSAIKILEPKNLALNMAVTTSSGWEDYPVTQVVDGDRENVGFHTDCSANQWVNIDLGRVQKIREVEVYNRADCCQSRASPLNLELSTDGKEYRSVQRRTGTFERWSVELPREEARFVRVTNESKNCFHLSEIEIH